MIVKKRFQNTIKREAVFNGVGLHSGQQINIRLKPAEPNSGIIFKRVDLKDKPEIKASIGNVISTDRSTSVGNKKIKVQTIEHLMAALMTYQIDNIVIEINGDEIPAADGSAKPFNDLLAKTKIIKQGDKTEIFTVDQVISYQSKDKYLFILPSNQLKLSYLLDYDHPMIGVQYLSYQFEKNSFIKNILPARTFGFEEEIKNLKSQGLALGGSLDNAVLIKDDSIVNELRFKDEFVRHKILDLIGDLYLIGSIRAEILAVKTGHHDNYNINRLIKKNIG
ncbi:MAG: UDP-3-O-acyl-N-acetylglucosamine deacetylase [Halanaerobiales bacterium]|nr:UDP-3-O-acyl-N-acetylglucosamine deacetylase [Halanaerobiales bacterium]